MRLMEKDFKKCKPKLIFKGKRDHTSSSYEAAACALHVL
jgi:hypothetical protein